VIPRCRAMSRPTAGQRFTRPPEGASLCSRLTTVEEATMAVRQGSTLSASIVSALKERIIAWQYPPEHRMTEEALCREFGVSRSPVREALRVLVTNGLIRRMPNRGYAVRQVSIKDIEELYDVRMALELYALESITERGTQKKALAMLRETWEAIAREPDSRRGN